MNDYRIIELRGRDGTLRGRVKVDADVDLGGYRWHLAAGAYAARSTRKPRKRMIYMHREILGLGPDDKRPVDHINGDTLDNRRSNLRVTTISRNGLNRRGAEPGGSSRFRGVFWNKQRGKWRAQIAYRGHNYQLGDFEVEADAGRAVLAFLADCDLVAAANASSVFADTLTEAEWRQQSHGAIQRLRRLDLGDCLSHP